MMWKNYTPLQREADLQVKTLENCRSRNAFGGSRRCREKHICESRCSIPITPFSDHFFKLGRRKIARCYSKKHICKSNIQNTACSDNYLKLGCGKIARRCSEKRICKSKCTKHSMLGSLFEVGMWKNCTRLQREAHLQVKMCKTSCSDHFWRLGFRKGVQQMT